MKRRSVVENEKVKSTNRDPITGATGAHPVGTGVGAALGGAAAGAAVGSVAGPVGTAVGAAAGAVVGGLAGKAVGEKINPTVEDAYWRDNYKTRSYVVSDKDYGHYRPAYEFGWQSRAKHVDARWEDAKDNLRQEWEKHQHSWALDWNAASPAIRDAWDRPLQAGDTQSAADQR
jgi:phage tail tape-measure protein